MKIQILDNENPVKLTLPVTTKLALDVLGNEEHPLFDVSTAFLANPSNLGSLLKATIIRNPEEGIGAAVKLMDRKALEISESKKGNLKVIAGTISRLGVWHHDSSLTYATPEPEIKSVYEEVKIADLHLFLPFDFGKEGKVSSPFYTLIAVAGESIAPVVKNGYKGANYIAGNIDLLSYVIDTMHDYPVSSFVAEHKR